jgi:HEPN domain-containing protein
MPHDPVLLAETSAWVRKAAEDLKVAESLLGVNPLFPSQVAFHAQQAAEKSRGLLGLELLPLQKDPRSCGAR